MNKSVSFITVHIGSNFGSNLQTIATSEVLKKLGFEPVCVNYIPPRITWYRYWKEANISIKKLLWRILYAPIAFLEKRRFSSYLSKHCKVSKAIYDSDDFVKECPKADVYMTGSDQVWNFTYNEGLDAHYFFDGVVGKKIAYASSIGNSELSGEEFGLVRDYTRDYTAISVRESSAVAIFEKMGRKVEHVLDPTMMLNNQEWPRFSNPRLIKNPYLFVYLPYNTVDKKLCYESIRKIAKEKKLQVVTFSYDFFKDTYADRTILFADPGDFLSLMIHADYVVTNSFHGTAFSINLHKNFFVFMPSKFSTRITSVLEMFGVEERLLTKEIAPQQIDVAIDYDVVERQLEDERNKANEYLKKALA